MRNILTISVLLLALRAVGAGTSFTKDIAPLFVAKCLSCHNAEKAKGGYRLHTFEALLKPGSSKTAPVVPGNASASYLFQLVTANAEEDRMPQKDDALSPAQILILREWIDDGAKFDGPDSSIGLAVLSAPNHPVAPKVYSVPFPITALSFTHSGDELAVSGYHEVTVWSSSAGKLLRRIGNIAERTFDMAFSPDGRWLACASGTPGRLGEVKLFDATNGELASLLVSTPDAMLCLAFSGDGKTLAAGGADNMIRVWHVENRRLSRTIEQHADWVLALALSPDGKRVATGSRDKSARVFEVVTGDLDETYTGHTDFVTAVCWADAKSILSASRMRTVHQWNPQDVKRTAEFSGWDGEVTRLLVNGTNLYSASIDGRVRTHGLATKRLSKTFEAHDDAVYALAVHGETQRLASGSHGGEVRVSSLASGKRIATFIAAPGYTATTGSNR